MPMLRPWLEEGFRRAGGGKGFADFEIQPRAEVAITDDVRGALARMKPRALPRLGRVRHHRADDLHRATRGDGADGGSRRRGALNMLTSAL
jgi:hypothetical protein